MVKLRRKEDQVADDLARIEREIEHAAKYADGLCERILTETSTCEIRRLKREIAKTFGRIKTMEERLVDLKQIKLL